MNICWSSCSTFQTCCCMLIILLLPVISGRDPHHRVPKNDTKHVVNSNTTRCKNIVWMHTPKTSSTFCMALHHICCKQNFEKLVQNVTLEALDENEFMDDKGKVFKFVSGSGCISFQNRNFPTFSCRRIKSDHSPLHVALTPRIYLPALNTTSVNGFASNSQVASATKPIDQPLTLGPAQKQVDAYTIIREPKSRIVSSFLDSTHHEGMSEAEFGVLKQSWDKLNGSSLEVMIKKLNLYANHPNMIGCQVKMLNGYECSHSLFVNHSTPDTINSTALDYAIKQLNLFHFVGIFEFYPQSLELLHKQSELGTTPSVVELYPQRSTNAKLAKILKRHLSLQDVYDSVLYLEALKIFRKKCELFGVKLTAEGASVGGEVLHIDAL